MASLRLLALVQLAVLCTAVNPGVKLRISQAGLDYAAKQAIATISADIRGKPIPDQHGEDRTKVGKVKYDFTGMTVTGFTAPIAKVTVQSGTSVTLSISNLGVSIHGDWHIEYKKAFIKIRDHGSFDVSVTGASIAIGVTLGMDSAASGRPTIHTTSCSSNVAQVKVKFHGGASWLYNLFDHKAANMIKDSLQKTLCSSASDAINVKGAKELAKAKVQVALGDFGVLDYRLVQPPVFGAGFVESAHKGEVFWKGNGSEAPFSPAALPEPPKTTHMLSIWLSDYMMNTLGDVTHNHGLLQYTLKSDDLPPKDRGILNTTCTSPTCFGNLLPKVKSLYPNCSIGIQMASTKAPTLQIIPTLLQGHFEGRMVFYAFMPNGSRAFLMDTLVQVNMSLTAGTKGDKITATVTTIKPVLKVNTSAIGFVSDVVMNTLFTFAANQFIKPQLNKVGQAGISLPSIEGVDYTNTDIQLLANAFCFSTDVTAIATKVKFNPSSRNAIFKDAY